MKPTVFIHTNEKQIVGAIVSAYSLKRNSPNADKFDVRVLEVKDFPFLRARHGEKFLRGGVERVWNMDDLQSFTPLRFAPPELMGYEGRAAIIDPDIFAAGDVWELLSRDMQGKALMCRARGGHNGRKEYLASSVMLLDCAKLKHWRVEENFAEMFAGKRDYLDWVSLALEPRETQSACSRRGGMTSTPSTRRPSSCTTPSAAPSPGRPACPSTSRRAKSTRA